MNYYQLFENYLDGKMSTQEKSSFEGQLKSNAEMKQAFDDHVKLIKSFDILLEKDVLAEINKLEQSHPLSNTLNKSISKNRNIYRRLNWIPVAASLVLLFGMLFVFKAKIITEEPNLYNKHKPSASLSIEDDTFRSEENKTIEDSKLKLNTAIRILSSDNIKQEDLNRAAVILESIDLEDKNYVMARYYLGISYLDIAPEKSKDILSDILPQTSAELKNKVEEILRDIEAHISQQK